MSGLTPPSQNPDSNLTQQETGVEVGIEIAQIWIVLTMSLPYVSTNGLVMKTLGTFPSMTNLSVSFNLTCPINLTFSHGVDQVRKQKYGQSVFTSELFPSGKWYSILWWILLVVYTIAMLAPSSLATKFYFLRMIMLSSEMLSFSASFAGRDG